MLSFDPDINRVVGGIAQIFHAVGLKGGNQRASPAMERVSRTLPCSSVNLRWLGVSVTTTPPGMGVQARFLVWPVMNVYHLNGFVLKVQFVVGRFDFKSNLAPRRCSTREIIKRKIRSGLGSDMGLQSGSKEPDTAL